jgi:uncharacterized protein YbjT (DUF2867 family)
MVKKILLTGATGYIGEKLLEKLLNNENVQLRLFVRDKKKVNESVRRNLEIIEGDTFNERALAAALEGIDITYYLIHSWKEGRNFQELEKVSARNFRDACIKANVERIIYLGGLANNKTSNKYLLSRNEVGRILSKYPEEIRTIWFRCGIVIGAGDSFLILMNIIKKLPIIIAAKWLETKVQTIFIEDALSYLIAAISLDVSKNIIVDIGSNEMTYKEIIKSASNLMNLSRPIISFPYFSRSLAFLTFLLLTPVNSHMAWALSESLESELLLENDNAAEYFPTIKAMPLDKSLKTFLCKYGKK